MPQRHVILASAKESLDHPPQDSIEVLGVLHHQEVTHAGHENDLEPMPIHGLQNGTSCFRSSSLSSKVPSVVPCTRIAAARDLYFLRRGGGAGREDTDPTAQDPPTDPRRFQRTPQQFLLIAQVVRYSFGKTARAIPRTTPLSLRRKGGLPVGHSLGRENPQETI